MTIIAFGDFNDARGAAVHKALDESGHVLFTTETAAAAVERYGASLRGVIVRSADQLRALTLALRKAGAKRPVALIALCERLDSRELRELHGAGADDVVALSDTDGLLRRLARLQRAETAAAPLKFKGRCLLAHSDVSGREVFARVLEEAGFEVDCVSDGEEALSVFREAPPDVAVVSSALPPEGGRRTLRRAAASSVPSVLLSPTEPGAFSTQGWAVVAEDAPPDELLFVVNDLMNPQELLGRRSSRRLLYATLCTFRPAGEMGVRAGLTYNLGREGLYVRTFDAPPAKSEVWLEFVPPGHRSWIHVRGSVAWSRAPSSGARTAPPGFGVLLNPKSSPPDDYALLTAKYDWLLGAVTAAEN